MFPISFGVCPSQELEIDLCVEEKPHDVGLEVIEQDIVDSSIGGWRRRKILYAYSYLLVILSFTEASHFWISHELILGNTIP